MKILAIDPGTFRSAFVVMNGTIQSKGILENKEMYLRLRKSTGTGDILAIEFIQSYGMPVGREVFETCAWCGVFEIVGKEQGWTTKRIARPKVKSFVTGIARAKDADVRRALITKYGGCKKGEPLGGIHKDMWAALAVADYVLEGLKIGRLEEW